MATDCIHKFSMPSSAPSTIAETLQQSDRKMKRRNTKTCRHVQKLIYLQYYKPLRAVFRSPVLSNQEARQHKEIIYIYRERDSVFFFFFRVYATRTAKTQACAFSHYYFTALQRLRRGEKYFLFLFACLPLRRHYIFKRMTIIVIPAGFAVIGVNYTFDHEREIEQDIFFVKRGRLNLDTEKDGEEKQLPCQHRKSILGVSTWRTGMPLVYMRSQYSGLYVAATAAFQKYSSRPDRCAHISHLECSDLHSAMISANISFSFRFVLSAKSVCKCSFCTKKGFSVFLFK